MSTPMLSFPYIQVQDVGNIVPADLCPAWGKGPERGKGKRSRSARGSAPHIIPKGGHTDREIRFSGEMPSTSFIPSNMLRRTLR